MSAGGRGPFRGREGGGHASWTCRIQVALAKPLWAIIFKLVPLLSGLLLLETNVQCPEPAAKPVIAGKAHS